MSPADDRPQSPPAGLSRQSPETPDLPEPHGASALEAGVQVSRERPGHPVRAPAREGDEATQALDPRDQALLELLRRLDALDYQFVPPTPATHARVVARPDRRTARTLRDVFGWSLPFPPGFLDPEVQALLERSEALERTADGARSRVRASRVRGRLFLHSAYPTEAQDSVFLGPDTYRFVDFAEAEMRSASVRRVVDIGTGAGVGGVLAGAWRPEARVLLTDVNPEAIRMARVNAAHAGVRVVTSCCKGVAETPGPIDLALANPPFIVDPSRRAYRDGGDMHGGRVSLDWALEIGARLELGGRMLLYTGSAIVDGRDPLREALERELPRLGCGVHYRELDPDIFGEELDSPAYADVDRIAAVGVVITRERRAR
jgi:methylase of polypeptide subunit release factors